MTSFKGQSCFVIGGKGKDFSTLDSVSRFNIDKDQWESGTPNLNIERSLAAACTSGDRIFVIGGVDGDNHYLNSVEVLNVEKMVSDEADWELVKFPTEVFTPRRNPLVTALNENEIVIMGGTDGENCLQDVLVYDIDKKQC